MRLPWRNQNRGLPLRRQTTLGGYQGLQHSELLYRCIYRPRKCHRKPVCAALAQPLSIGDTNWLIRASLPFNSMFVGVGGKMINGNWVWRCLLQRQISQSPIRVFADLARGCSATGMAAPGSILVPFNRLFSTAWQGVLHRYGSQSGSMILRVTLHCTAGITHRQSGQTWPHRFQLFY